MLLICGISFLCWAAQKQICRLLNSRRADAHLHVFFMHCTDKHHSMIRNMHLGSTKTKPASHTPEYTLLHILHQHTWSIHKSYIFKIIQNIANLFAGFWKCACWILCEIHENQCTQILQFLQYTTNPEISQCILILTWAIIYNYNNYDNNEIKNELIIKRMNN